MPFILFCFLRWQENPHTVWSFYEWIKYQPADSFALPYDLPWPGEPVHVH